MSWALKPNLLPAHLAAVLGARKWRTPGSFAAALRDVSVLAGLIIGSDGVRGLLQASSARFHVATAQPDGHPEGFALLVLAQSLLGIGAAATTLTVIGSVLTCLAMGWTWRGGLAPDGSR